MDRNILGGAGSIDAYIICNYMNSKLVTDVITAKEGHNVDWNCEFLVRFLLVIIIHRFHVNYLLCPVE